MADTLNGPARQVSEQSTAAPSVSSSAETFDFPVPMPPVRPTVTDWLPATRSGV